MYWMSSYSTNNLFIRPETFPSAGLLEDFIDTLVIRFTCLRHAYITVYIHAFLQATYARMGIMYDSGM